MRKKILSALQEGMRCSRIRIMSASKVRSLCNVHNMASNASPTCECQQVPTQDKIDSPVAILHSLFKLLSFNLKHRRHFHIIECCIFDLFRSRRGSLPLNCFLNKHGRTLLPTWWCRNNSGHQKRCQHPENSLRPHIEAASSRLAGQKVLCPIEEVKRGNL